MWELLGGLVDWLGAPWCLPDASLVPPMVPPWCSWVPPWCIPGASPHSLTWSQAPLRRPKLAEDSHSNSKGPSRDSNNAPQEPPTVLFKLFRLHFLTQDPSKMLALASYIVLVEYVCQFLLIFTFPFASNPWLFTFFHVRPSTVSSRNAINTPDSSTFLLFSPATS